LAEPVAAAHFPCSIQYRREIRVNHRPSAARREGRCAHIGADGSGWFPGRAMPTMIRFRLDSEERTAVKIAGVQMDVSLGDVDGNLERMATFLRETTAAGAALTIFPECSVTGYCFESLESGRRLAQSIPGPATD